MPLNATTRRIFPPTWCFLTFKVINRGNTKRCLFSVYDPRSCAKNRFNAQFKYTWILCIHIISHAFTSFSQTMFQISLQAWKVIGIHGSHETNINGWQQACSVIFQNKCLQKNCNKNNVSSYSNFIVLLNSELLAVPCLKVIENTNPSQTFFSWTETKRQTIVLKNKIENF